MELFETLFEVLMHLDRYMDLVIRDYGVWTYMILFLIIFCETGLVVTPILPGDSLLFAIGSIAAMGSLDFQLLLLLLTLAAILGDTVNYGVGHFVGPKVFNTRSRFFKKEYMDRTRDFYDRYGGKTIILARFIPIVRTFAPFVAGIGAMSYRRFIVYNVIGAIIWIGSFVSAGYYFGSLPAIKQNFSVVMIVIVVLSILLGISGFIRSRKNAA